MAYLDGGQLVARALKQEGVECIFTLSGFHIAQIYNGCLDEGIRIIDTRHEQAAAHAADGWARITRKVGVAVVTAGPGVTDAVTGVANAYQADSPMLLIGGQGPLIQAEMWPLQEMDHVTLMHSITKWSRSAHETRRIPEYVSIAFRQALSGRMGPVFLEAPWDVLTNSIDEENVLFPKKYRTEARTLGDPLYIQKAIQALEKGKKPVLIAGGSVWWGHAEKKLAEFVDRARIPVYLNGMGRGCVPADHPCFFQYTRKHALAAADVILVIGTPLDFRLGYGKGFNSEATVIRVEVDATQIGHNRDIDIGIVGDTGAVLEQLTQGISACDTKEWLEELRTEEKRARTRMEPAMHSISSPVHPYRFAYEIDQFIDEETVLIGDGGNIVGNASKVIKVDRPGQWLDPGRFGCLGVGMPFALAAQVARPKSKVLVIYGDGSFGFNGMEFDTAIRHKLPIVAIVGNDAAWTQIREPQISVFGEDRAPATTLLPTRYDKIVEAMGGHGEYVERPEEIRPALERAFDSGKPACVNVRIDQKENKGSYGGVGL
jgi:acetolactate synthase-1/2/3 large subunit